MYADCGIIKQPLGKLYFLVNCVLGSLIAQICIVLCQFSATPKIAYRGTWKKLQLS